jgi:uncharacterized cupredoxin-like copper-binding protein
MKNRHTLWLSFWHCHLAVLLAACSAVPRKGQRKQHHDQRGGGGFLVSLDASQAEAGTITFVVQNNSSMPHDFALEGNGVEQKTPMINSGESATLTVDLEPGTYTYVCTIPGHEQLGMSGTFTVTSN